MLLRYKGEGHGVSLIKGSYYEAEKFCDDIGEAWAIFDEGDDWYVYGLKFVEENFEIVDEDEQEISHAI